MPQVNGGVIARRAAQLRQKGVEALKLHLANAKGRRIAVLMESFEPVAGSVRAAE